MTGQPGALAARTLERLVRRDRLVVAAGLAAITAIAWIYLFRMPTGMAGMTARGDMGGMDMSMPDMPGMPGMDARSVAAPDPFVWTATDYALTFAMWAVMMVAMMLPSAAPVILLVTGTYRRRGRGSPAALPFVFAAGYLAVWTTFSAIAALAQLWLHERAVLSPMMASTSAGVSAALLAAAGIYQWLPIKNACLSHCRSPIGFLSHEWREGAGGAFVMGVRHGAYCVGCCWVLMALLFVIGVMNLAWVAAIAAFVLLEKMLPARWPVARIAGAGLIVAAVVVGWP